MLYFPCTDHLNKILSDVSEGFYQGELIFYSKYYENICILRDFNSKT